MENIKQSAQNLLQEIWSKWHIIIFTAIIAGSIGYSIGSNNILSQSPSAQPVFTALPTPLPTLMLGDDGDVDYLTANGIVTTNTTYYDQIFVTIDQWKNEVTTRAQYDMRIITKPQLGVKYPYVFARLTPGITYIVSITACHTYPNGSLTCVATAKVAVSNCSGKIDSSGCVFSKSGTADFFVTK